jgi:pyruvate dehydrogenase E2 component (dihydrolipoamide acetyltransferase)
MATQVTMPKMGLSMVTGKVSRWLKRQGETVRRGEALVEIMTDKITNIVEAPADGIVLRIAAAEEEELPVGGLLAVIGVSGETAPATEPATGPTTAAEGQVPSGEKIRISPLARKLAEEKDLDIAGITGTGPAGRITREDVERAIAAGPDAAVPAGAAPKPAAVGERAFTVRPYSGMRKAIGDNMARSWAIAPKVNYHVSVDVSALLALRKAINEDGGDKITLTDLLVKIVARALKLRPRINVSLDGGEIRQYEDANIGVAVALGDGLVVPVVRQADAKTLSQISREIKDLARRAGENALALEELQGGTFTVTNIGAYQSVDWFTPIINQPESAILGIGRIVEQPAVVGGEVVARPILGLSLAFDHRVIDGAPAAEFLGLLLGLIGKPYQVLI